MPPKTRSRSVNLNLDDVNLSDLSNDGKIIIKTLTEILSDKIEELKSSYEEALAERDRENAKLRNDFNLMKKNYDRLTERVEDLETNGRKCDLVISGQNVPVENDGENLKSVSEAIIKNNLNIKLPEGSIVRGTRIGPKTTGVSRLPRRSILIRFSSSDLVQDVIKSAKTVRPDKIFMNRI